MAEINNDTAVPGLDTGSVRTAGKAKSPKKAILLAVWIVLLGGLMFGITHFNSNNVAGGADGTAPSGPPPAPAPDVLARRWPEIVKHAAAPPRGSAAAPYTMAEFGDFQCPQCGKVRPMIEQVLAKYPRQVNLIFVHRPFPNIHHWAIPAAQASVVAASQGKFWPMYDILYTHQDDLEPGFYGTYAAKAGMDKAQFDAAFKTGGPQQTVQQASDFSDALGIQETPTVIVHDNVHGTITSYLGLNGNATPGGGGTPGIKDLVAHPPWTVVASRAAGAR